MIDLNSQNNVLSHQYLCWVSNQQWGREECLGSDPRGICPEGNVPKEISWTVVVKLPERFLCNIAEQRQDVCHDHLPVLGCARGHQSSSRILLPAETKTMDDIAQNLSQPVLQHHLTNIKKTNKHLGNRKSNKHHTSARHISYID